MLFFFSRHDFFLLPFFSVSICAGLHFLVLRLVVKRPRLKSLCLADWYSNQLVLERGKMGKLIQEWLSYPESFDKWLLPMLSLSKGKKNDFNFVDPRTVISWQRLRAQSIRVFSRRRRSFSITAFPSFNHQTIIWNVGWNGLVLWIMTPESVTLVVSSRFTVLYIVLWFLTCTEILCKSSYTTAWFVVILRLSDSRVRDPLTENIQCWSTDSNYWCS